MTRLVIPLSEPVLDGNEARYLLQCVRTGMVSSVGDFVGSFEREFATLVGAPAAVACSSGTAALHLALVALGIGPAAEVWVSDLTFIASANPASYCGASLTFVDADPDSWNLDPHLVADELRRRSASSETLPDAIIPVHLYGHPADLSWHALAAELGVPVVEDAAEAVGASWLSGPHEGRAAGSIGTFGCFSFNGNKLLTSGGGGMLVSDDMTLLKRARHLSTQARVEGSDYLHDEVGFNYRMTNVAAAVGLAQLERLGELVAGRAAVACQYEQGFEDDRSVRFWKAAPWARRNNWLSCVTFPSGEDRDRAREALRRHGIDARPVWTPMSQQPMYRTARRLGTGEVASSLWRRGLCLPSSPNLDRAQIGLIVRLVREAVGG